MDNIESGIEQTKSRRRLPEWVLWTLYGLAVVSALGLFSLVFVESFSRQIPWWGKLLVIAFMALCIALWGFEKRDAFAEQKAVSDRLRDPETLQAILTLVLLIASAVPNVLGMIRPSAALEDQPGLIQDTVIAIDEKQDEGLATLQRIERNTAPQPAERPAILDRISGLWGEPGCDVVWRFTVSETSIKAEVVEKPITLPDYTYLGSVSAVDQLTLQSVGEQPDSARGMAATFVLDQSGALPRLSWNDRVRSVPLVLEPCE